MLAFSPCHSSMRLPSVPSGEHNQLRSCSFQRFPSRANQLHQFADTTSSRKAMFGPRRTSFSHSRHRISKTPRLRVDAISPGDAARWDGGRDGDGDQKLQQLLVDLVRVQCGETRMTSLVEERQRRLKRIGVDSAEELNRITHRAMKGVDELSNRVLRQVDLGAYAIERDLALARMDMEARQREFEEFERRMHLSRNEGLFFKGLYSTSTLGSSRLRGSRGRTTSGGSSSNRSIGRSGRKPQRSGGAAPASAVNGAFTQEQAKQQLVGPSDRRGASSQAAMQAQPTLSSSPHQTSFLTIASLPSNSTSDDISTPADSETNMPPVASTYKRLLHTALAIVLASFLWSNTSAMLAGHLIRPPKLMAYSCIFSALLLQLNHEPSISGREGQGGGYDSGEEGSSSDEEVDVVVGSDGLVGAPPLLQQQQDDDDDEKQER